MQVERSTSVLSGERVSNTWVTCPQDEDNHWKRWLRLDRNRGGISLVLKDLATGMLEEGPAAH